MVCKAPIRASGVSVFSQVKELLIVRFYTSSICALTHATSGVNNTQLRQKVKWLRDDRIGDLFDSYCDFTLFNGDPASIKIVALPFLKPSNQAGSSYELYRLLSLMINSFFLPVGTNTVAFLPRGELVCGEKATSAFPACATTSSPQTLL